MVRRACFWGAILGLFSCAGAIKKASDIRVSDTSLEQKIEEFKGPPSPGGPGRSAPATPSGAETTSKVATLPSAAAESASQKTAKPKAKKEKAPKVAESGWLPKAWPFGLGEKVSFALRYGPIEGGIVDLEVKAPKIIDGVPALHYTAHAQSSRVLELFYRIDNTLNTYVDLSTHLPLRQELEQSESARTGRRVVVFDQTQKIVKYFSKIIKKNGEVEEIRRDDPVTHNAQDIFGAIYFYRFIDDLRKSRFPVHDRWKEWNADLKYLGEEKVYVPAGEYETLHFAVTPRISGNLESKGEAELWVSKDVRKLLVKFKARVKIGSITGELRAYVPGSPFPYPLPNMKTPINLGMMAR